jgi:GPH family glycoside/pentoside/hexuronide:cation symporter
LPGPPTETRPLRAARVWREYAAALRLPAFRSLFASLVTNYGLQGVLHTLSLYVLTYFWRLSGPQISLLMVSGFGGMVVGALLAGPFSRRVGDKRPSAVIALVWYALVGSAMVILRLLDWAPEDGHPALVPLICAGSLLGGMGNGAMATLGASMIADVTDEHERAYRMRQEGIYYGSVSFAYKAASGLGTALAGIAIDAVGLGPQSDPASVAPAVVTGLGIVYGPLFVVGMLIPVSLLLAYPVNRARHADTQRVLAARRAGAAGGSAS